MATDYNRELLVVPGSIFSKTSEGVHQFLKLGATPVTSAKDILDVLGIEKKGAATAKPLPLLSPNEQKVITLLSETRHRDELIRLLEMNISEASQLLMMMELSGHISSHDNIYRTSL
jgi:DNA processing protein